MLCEQCADCIGGFCRSTSTDARKRQGAALRDQWEISDCDDFRPVEDRPPEDEELEECWLAMLERIEKSGAWEPQGDETAQGRADYAAMAWRGHMRLLPGGALDHWRDLSGDLRERMIRLLVDCPELEDARGKRYRMTWRTTKWTSQGSACWGSSKPIPQPQREKFGIAESWEIILSLPIWLLLDDDGKDRLLHHELMHAATNERGHPVSEWPETVARYGLGNASQALLALAGIAHDSAQRRIETWGLLPSGQTQLWIGEGMEQIQVGVEE